MTNTLKGSWQEVFRFLGSFAAREMTLPCTDRETEVYHLQLPQGKVYKYDPDDDLMSPATPEDGTKAVEPLSVGTDTRAITSIINHRSSKG